MNWVYQDNFERQLPTYQLNREEVQVNLFASICQKWSQLPALRAFVVTFTTLTIAVGCAGDSGSRARDTAGAGAIIGAGIGLLIGAARGEPAAGLAVGAAVGAGQGAYEGWKQDQDDERTRQITDAIRATGQSRAAQMQNQDQAAQARQELTRFLGVWSMEGWLQESGKDRQQVSAKVNGNIEMNYFVELAYIDLKVIGVDTQLWGASTLGYDEGDGYNISTRFNTIPEPIRATGGTFDPSSSTFMFKGPDFKVSIKFNGQDRFTAETKITNDGREQTVESYRFTRS